MSLPKFFAEFIRKRNIEIISKKQEKNLTEFSCREDGEKKLILVSEEKISIKEISSKEKSILITKNKPSYLLKNRIDKGEIEFIFWDDLCYEPDMHLNYIVVKEKISNDIRRNLPFLRKKEDIVSRLFLKTGRCRIFQK